MLERVNLQSKKGQSIIEIIVAVAIFIIIASTAVMAILGSFSSSRLAKEESKAAFLCTEGLEASQSIRNQDWSNLTSVSHGLTKASGNWAFLGAYDDDPSGKFRRVVAVSDVQRDANRDIVVSGGTVDPDTKKITGTVTWNFTPARQNTVQMVSFLTNWQMGKNKGSVSGVDSCASFCQSFTYSGGTCRENPNKCDNYGETYESGGNPYCTGGENEDSCCCLP